MLIVRVARRRRYTIVDRDTTNDARLSFRARGLLVYLLDKPDDWATDAAALARATTEGRDAIRTALGELERFGYLVRRRVQDAATGRWRTEAVLYECPGGEGDVPGAAEPDAWKPVPGATRGDGTKDLVAPGPGNPAAGNPAAGKPGAKSRSTETETDTEEGSSLRDDFTVAAREADAAAEDEDPDEPTTCSRGRGLCRKHRGIQRQIEALPSRLRSLGRCLAGVAHTEFDGKPGVDDAVALTTSELRGVLALARARYPDEPPDDTEAAAVALWQEHRGVGVNGDAAGEWGTLPPAPATPSVRCGCGECVDPHFVFNDDGTVSECPNWARGIPSVFEIEAS